MEKRDITSGTVELPSGQWHWVLHDRWQGLLIVLHHRERPWEEMRSWINGKRPTEQTLREHILDPLERRWKDGSGRLWMLSMEIPREWRRSARAYAPVEKGRRWLLFRSGRVTRVAVVPEGRGVAEFGDDELLRLLDEAAGGAGGDGNPWSDPDDAAVGEAAQYAGGA